MSEAEGRSMAVAGVVLLVASVVRWGWEVGQEPLAVPGDTAVAEELLEASREELEEEELRSRPLEDGETLDPNRAPAPQLDRLPGVGAATARAIVEEREANAYFRSPADLARVRGIGPATVAKITPYLDFSRPPPPRPLVGPRRSPGVRRGPSRPGVEEAPRIDLNRAGEMELQTLKGIGPALARRILEFRKAEGPFRRVEDLLKVRGIGPATLQRLKDHVRIGR